MTEAKNAILFVKSKDRSTWLNRARRDPRVSHFGFRIAFMIAEDTDENGTISQKPIEIAGRAGVHLGTLMTALDSLSRLGYISFERGGYRQPANITMRAIMFEKRTR
jgi:DNA-binding MarR family transcriptional regulator